MSALPLPFSDAYQLPYIYKSMTADEWKASQNCGFIVPGKLDTSFIHLATEKQLPAVLEKFWKNLDFIVAQINPRKLIGNLVLEQNPGGLNFYPHLYNGTIPLSAIEKLQKFSQSVFIEELPLPIIYRP